MYILYMRGDNQKGYRTAIVIFNDVFNKNTKMGVSGSVLCEHVRSIDYEIRYLKYLEKASVE